MRYDDLNPAQQEFIDQTIREYEEEKKQAFFEDTMGKIKKIFGKFSLWRKSLKKYLWYFGYVMSHKWYVFLACWRRQDLVRGLVWRGIVHDLSKFLPSEFGPYARYFHGRDLKDGTYQFGTGEPEFDAATTLHFKRNRHHWQYWTRPNECDPETPENPALTPLEIPALYCLEMICDWEGAHRAKKTEGSVEEWWGKNKQKMRLTENTQIFVNSIFYNEGYQSYHELELYRRINYRLRTVGRK